MDYEEKFRDFMVGWLADQLPKPGANRQKLNNLYQIVVEAENDAEALAELETVLGQETARKLWQQSDQWHDPTVAEAQEMITALRASVQADGRDPAAFYLFFVNPFKVGCVPDAFEEQIEREISWMFRLLYSVVGEAVLSPHGWEPYVVVEPSYEDASEIIVLAQPKAEVENKVFVYQRWYKAWHLRCASLTELAQELLGLRQALAQHAHQMISRDRRRMSDE